ncbi:MAG: hypothetical protein ACI8X5_001735 [Planctomycetota bacterium]|jgi:hypothetical protein
MYLFAPVRFASALAALLLLFLSASAQCPEEPARAVWTGSGSAVCPCFVAGEEAGSVL